MPRALFVNNLEMILTAPVAPGDNTITVDDASRCPNIAPLSGDYFKLTIEEPTNLANREIVLATQVVGNTIFVLRGREGTPVGSHPVGAKVENRNTAVTLDQFPQRDDDTTITGKFEFTQHPSVQGQDVWTSDNVQSSDPEILAIDGSDPAAPLLQLFTNIANGTVKLDANGNIPVDLLPLTGLQPLGPFRGDNDCPKPGDTDPGDCTEPDYRNPSERAPGTNYSPGQFFIITTPGDVNLLDPATGNDEVTPVTQGDFIIYVEDVGPTNADGWAHVPRDVTILASEVIFDDSTTDIKGANVQVWNEAADAKISEIDAGYKAGDQILEESKVNRAGDTMTGDLTIEKANPALVLSEISVADYFTRVLNGQYRVDNALGASILRWDASQEDFFTTSNRKLLTTGDLGDLGDYTRRDVIENIEEAWKFVQGLSIGLGEAIRVGDAGPDYSNQNPTDTTGWTQAAGNTWTHTPGNTNALTWADVLPSALVLLDANQVGEYACTISIAGRTAGTVALSLSGAGGTPRDANGLFVEILTATGQDILVEPSSDFDGTVSIIVRFTSVNLVSSTANTATLGNPFANTALVGQNIGFIGSANFLLQPFVLGNQIWHEGNQGAGSGLDADFLRGLTPEQLGRDLTTQDPQTLNVTNGATEIDVTTITNEANGLAKLNAVGKIPPELIPIAGLNPLGIYRGDNDCPKPGDDPADCTEPDYRNPSERFPATTFTAGDFFLVSTAGDINLIDRNTLTPTVTPVDAGDLILFLEEIILGQETVPEGWYHVPRDTGQILASDVLFDDSGTTIKGTTVQQWNEAADTEIAGKTNRVGGETVSGIWNFESNVNVQGTLRGSNTIISNHPSGSEFQTRWVTDTNSNMYFSEYSTGAWRNTVYIQNNAVIRPANATPGGGILNELGSAGFPWNRIHVETEVLVGGNPVWTDNVPTLGGDHTFTGASINMDGPDTNASTTLRLRRSANQFLQLLESSSGSFITSESAPNNAKPLILDNRTNDLSDPTSGNLDIQLRINNTTQLRLDKDGGIFAASNSPIWHDSQTTLGGNHTATGLWNFNATQGLHAGRPTDHWSNGNYFGLTDIGQLSTEGSFGLFLTWNGYRRQADNLWESYAANSSEAAIQIGLAASGIQIRAADSWLSGSAANPTLRAFFPATGGLNVGAATGTGGFLFRVQGTANVTGNTTLGGTLSVAQGTTIGGALVVNNANSYLQGDGNVHLWWRTVAGEAKGLAYWNNTNSRMHFRAYNAAGNGAAAEILLNQNEQILLQTGGATRATIANGATTFTHAVRGIAPVNDADFTRKDYVDQKGATIISDTAPDINTVGDGTLWWDSSVGNTFIAYDDGSSKQWVQQSIIEDGGDDGGAYWESGPVTLSGANVTTAFPDLGQVVKIEVGIYNMNVSGQFATIEADVYLDGVRSQANYNGVMTNPAGSTVFAWTNHIRLHDNGAPVTRGLEGNLRINVDYNANGQPLESIDYLIASNQGGNTSVRFGAGRHNGGAGQNITGMGMRAQNSTGLVFNAGVVFYKVWYRNPP